VRRLITLMDRVGDRGSALRVYDEFYRLLDTEFQITPSPGTTALADQIRARSQRVPSTQRVLWIGVTGLLARVPSWLALA
jgi:DNA-binding SARP family transcriptional activator